MASGRGDLRAAGGGGAAQPAAWLDRINARARARGIGDRPGIRMSQGGEFSRVGKDKETGVWINDPLLGLPEMKAWGIVCRGHALKNLLRICKFSSEASLGKHVGAEEKRLCSAPESRD